MFKIEVKADYNDADYVYNTEEIDSLNDVFLTKNELFEGSEELQWDEFLTLLGEALRECAAVPNHHRHNWSNDDDEENILTNYTVRRFAEKIGFTDKNNEDDLENISEVIGDLIPYGEYGVHTVVSIRAIPADRIIKYL